MRSLAKVIGMGVLLSCVCLVPAQDFVITTVAGGALPSTPAPATNVSIHYPQDVAVDSAGNVYTSTMNAIFKMDKSGVLTRLAGASSASGYSGDGKPGTSAQLNSPQGLAVDAAGNVYVADSGNYVVRKVATDGTISTVVGNGNWGTAGDGGPAAAASLKYPTGLTFDSSGNLYIADGSANQIRKVTTDGVIHTILTGTLSYPNGLAIDASGNLYIADTGNNVIRKLAPDGTLTKVAGAGGAGSFYGEGVQATAAKLNGPYGVALDAAGILYIADSSNSVIRRVGSDGIIQSVVGRGASSGFSGDGGAAANAQLWVPGGIRFDNSGVLYIADVGNSRIRKVTVAGTISTIIGGGQLSSGDGSPATSVQLNSPFGSPAVIGGDLFVADSQNNRIRKIAADGTITTVAGTGTAGSTGDGGPATSAQLSLPYGLAADASGNLYVIDQGNPPSIRKITPGGTITTIDHGAYPTAIALDSSGNIYFTSPNTNIVIRISPDLTSATFAGRISGIAGSTGDGGPATQAALSNPQGVAVDSAGNVYIADTGNNRIRKVSADGIITNFAGNGTQGYSGDGGAAINANLYLPQSVAVDSAGNVYIADSGNSLIREVTPDGIIHRIAGGYGGSYSGDGGPATSAGLSAYALAVDSQGKVYFTDYYDSVVRMLTPAGRVPVLTLSMTHGGTAVAGQPVNSSIVVTNAASAAATSGTVTIIVKATSGLALQNLSGVGWNCNSNSCSRSDALAAGSSYAPITVTSKIDVNASSQVTAMASLSGGGAAYGASAQDVITVAAVASNCTYSIAPGGQFFAPSGDTGTIGVTAGSGCAWSATSDSGWVSIKGSGSGFGPGSVSFTVAANAGSRRVGTITVGGQFFSVVQNGAIAAGLNAAGSLAHLVSGAGWASTITLVNTGSASSALALNFHDNSGSPLSLPFSLPLTGGSESGPSLERTLNANSLLIVKTGQEGDAAGQEGWAQLLAGGTVSGFETFQNLVTNYQAVVPLETRDAPSYLLAFDNTGGVTTGMAIANLSTGAAQVPVILRDETGGRLTTSKGFIRLDPEGHAAFMLNDTTNGFPETAGKRGTIEFDTPSGGRISALGLRANNGKALTTLPVLANVGTGGGTMPHIVFGSGWQTILTLVNTGTTPAQMTLNYFDNSGAALTVPMAFPQTATTATASSVTQTLAGNASLVIVTQGDNGAATSAEGWAQLQSSGNVSGFAIFQYLPSSQEAVVPLLTGNPNALVLAFDNTNGESTGVALANPAAGEATIPVTILDETGAPIYRDSIPLTGHGHLAFGLTTQYPTTTNRRGTIEFDRPSSGQIGALGIRAVSASGVITTLPALAK